MQDAFARIARDCRVLLLQCQDKTEGLRAIGAYRSGLQEAGSYYVDFELTERGRTDGKTSDEVFREIRDLQLKGAFKGKAVSGEFCDEEVDG